MSKLQRYLILPARGLQATPATAAVHSFLTGLVSAEDTQPLRSRLFVTVAASAAAASRRGTQRSDSQRKGAEDPSAFSHRHSRAGELERARIPSQRSFHDPELQRRDG